jgi:hypothetical protein
LNIEKFVEIQRLDLGHRAMKKSLISTGGDLRVIKEKGTVNGPHAKKKVHMFYKCAL